MFPYLCLSREGTWDSHHPGECYLCEWVTPSWRIFTPPPLLAPPLPPPIPPSSQKSPASQAWRTTSLPMGTGPSDAFSKGAFPKQRRSLFPAECLPPGPLACFHLQAFVAHLFGAVPRVQGFKIFFLSSQPFHQVSGITPGLKTRNSSCVDCRLALVWASDPPGWPSCLPPHPGGLWARSGLAGSLARERNVPEQMQEAPAR